MQDDNILAGATSSNPTPSPSEAREVFPVKFDKDYMDFRPEAEEPVDEVPKGWSAQASVTPQNSLIPGLEDVSTESLDENAQPPAERDKTKTNTTPIDSGKQTSSEETSPGKSEQPVDK